MSRSFDFRLAPQRLPDGEDLVLGSRVDPADPSGVPKLALMSTAGEESMWNAVVQPDRRSVLLSTRALWRRAPVRVLDIDDHGVLVLAALERGGQAEWNIYETFPREGVVSLRHARTGLHVVVGEGSTAPEVAASGSRLDAAARFALSPPRAAAKLAEEGVLGIQPAETLKPQQSPVILEDPDNDEDDFFLLSWHVRILGLLLFFSCLGGGGAVWAMVYRGTESWPTEKALRQGIEKRDLELLKAALPRAKPERLEYEDKLRAWDAQEAVDASGGVEVQVELSVEGIDFEKVEEGQRAALVAFTKRRLSEFAHVRAINVDPVRMSPGSKKVHASIAIPHRRIARGRKEAAMMSAPRELLQALATDARRIKGMEQATVATIHVPPFQGPFELETKDPKPRDPVPSLEDAEATVSALVAEAAAKEVEQAAANAEERKQVAKEVSRLTDAIQQAASQLMAARQQELGCDRDVYGPVAQSPSRHLRWSRRNQAAAVAKSKAALAV